MIKLEPVATVHNSRTEVEDDNWGGVVSEIVLTDAYPDEAFDGIEAFSHVEVLYFFDRVAEEKIEVAARHPRDNPGWPKVGIFAQRGKDRPNRLGLSAVRLLGREGRRLRVQGLDAINGTPVLDIKPVMKEYLPREAVSQPNWASELMREYWEP